MTDLNKPVRRRTCRPHDHRGRRLVVALLPGDVLEVREERTRRGFSLPLADVYQHLVECAVRARERRINNRIRELIRVGVGRREAKRIAKQEVE